MTALLVPLDELRRRISLAALIGRRISLARRGREFVALCPFHHEKTPSFYVVEDKGFYHCFGCGAHGEHVSFVMRYHNLDRADAVEKLASEVGLDRSKPSQQRPDVASRRPPPAADKEQTWIPVLPVPRDAPPLLRPDGRTIELINPKQAGTQKERVRFRPVMWWPYRNAEGLLLGFVLRMEFRKPDGTRGKWTPQITFCAGPSGARRWCVVAFPEPRPLYGLAELAARPQAPVIVTVEGEKASDAGRRLLPEYVVVTWPGGSKSITHVDWSSLGGRDVLLVLDNDQWARQAADGWIDRSRKHHAGLVELLAPIAERMCVVDPPAELPGGWDLADAEKEGWTQTDAARWLVQHLRPANVIAAATAQPNGQSVSNTNRGRAPSRNCLHRGRLEGLVRKIITAGQQREGTLRWACGVLGAAADNGDIRPELAQAMLVRAGMRAGLGETAAQRLVAASFQIMGALNEGERRRPWA